MKIAAAALNQTPLDWDGNVARIATAIQEAKKQNASLLLLPELVLSGYGCEDYFFMPWLADKVWHLLLSEILPLSDRLGIGLGIPFWHDSKLYNGLAFCEKGKISGIYAKQLLPHSGIFYEPRWFSSWSPNQKIQIEKDGQSFWFGDFTLPFQGLQIGFEICEDAWQVDKRPALFGAARDADLILNASASNFARGKRSERQEVITDLKDKNDAYYLYANLLGNESGRIIFDGELMFGAEGQIWEAKNRLSFKEVEVTIFEMAEVRPSQPEVPSEENDFEDFTQACTLGLWDYLRKSGSKGFALSLSGGADSAACAVLVAEMLRRLSSVYPKSEIEKKLLLTLKGKSWKDWVSQLLFCVYQSTENSSPITRFASENIAKELNASFFSWEIDGLVGTHVQHTEQFLGRKLDWKTDDLALQNIQARSRAPGIWLLANTQNLLLLTTSNRSEGAVGYCTMDGDTAGSLAPLAGVSKHFIRRWLVWAKENLGYSSLKEVIEQAPTAELRPLSQKQTDEADLMPYHLLEEIESLFLWEQIAPQNLETEMKKRRPEVEPEKWPVYISKFLSLWKRSQWKRERLAPSFHLDRFNIDPKSGGRFPIFSK
jgi:NAD+ synthase (glutamine-hydrolysing)